MTETNEVNQTYLNNSENSENNINRIIQMAWEDRTPFEAIEIQFSLKEKDVIKLMKAHLKHSSYVLWRERVKGRQMKHLNLVVSFDRRFKSKAQGNLYYHKTKRK